MVLDPTKLPDRDFTYLLDRLKWLDQEVTRYRDFEWKATSYHTAFFAALLYLLLDVPRKQILQAYRYWLGIAVCLYCLNACFHLLYMHKRLNERREERSNLIQRLGESVSAGRFRICGFYEGLGAFFVFGFVLWLLFLAATSLRLLLRG